LLILFSAPTAFSQSAKLIEAAKKEGGKAVVYGSLESSTFDEIVKAYKKKTGLDVDYWRASATKVMDRALSEYRAGRPLFDIVLTNDNPMQIMHKAGIFAKYESPTFKDFPKEAIDPKGTGRGVGGLRRRFFCNLPAYPDPAHAPWCHRRMDYSGDHLHA
jgi:hypothetical protein